MLAGWNEALQQVMISLCYGIFQYGLNLVAYVLIKIWKQILSSNYSVVLSA